MDLDAASAEAEVELLDPGAPARLLIRLSPVAAVLPPGHRLVAYLSSADWPRFERNPSTGADHWESGGGRLEVALHPGDGQGLLLRLPVAGGR